MAMAYNYKAICNDNLHDRSCGMKVFYFLLNVCSKEATPRCPDDRTDRLAERREASWLYRLQKGPELEEPAVESKTTFHTHSCLSERLIPSAVDLWKEK